MLKKINILIVIMSVFSSINMKAADSLQWSEKMAQSIMLRNPSYYSGWDYVTGTVLRSFKELWERTGDSVYFKYIKKTVDVAVTSTGSIKGYKLTDYNIDEINEGRMLLFLYQHTKEVKYKIAADLLYKQLSQHPRTTEGGFWHKNRYPDQMWLDGLYMGSPFLIEYSKMFGIEAEYAESVRQSGLMEKYMRDSVTGLLYHGWDEAKVQEWADSITGCSPSFWGRAMGWYAMAVIEMLDELPKNYSGRDSLIHIIQRLAEAVTAYQDTTTGCWYQVLDQGGREGNYIEASASCMFAYTLAKAVRLQYIDSLYLPIAQKAMNGILKNFISYSDNTIINLEKTCATAGLGYGRDGSYDYYISQTTIAQNDGKGLGPFIMACLEFEKFEPKDTSTHEDTLDQTSIKRTNDSIDLRIIRWNENNITLKIKSNSNGPAIVRVSDLYGRLICAEYLREISYCEILEMNFNTPLKGMYIYSLHTSNGNRILKTIHN